MCRYALYYTPAPDSMAHELLSALLGRDALRDTLMPQPTLPGITPELLKNLTAAPAHYGVHATLKAPFHLREDVTASLLLARVRECAAVQKPFYTPPLALTLVEQRFFALTCLRSCPSLCALERCLVTELDHLRAPLTQHDKTRRGPLPFRQQQNLSTWGYHKVLDDFVFHISLTGPVTDPQLALRLEPLLKDYLHPVLQTELYIHGLSVFRQRAAHEPFSLMEYVPFGNFCHPQL